jgi:hypothetical protein
VEHSEEVTYIGRTDFRGAERLFGIKRKDRRQHMYIVGKSGTGKSTLINNLIVQDIANGEGVAVVDPHGELVEGVMDRIPQSRQADVVYFNPSDLEYSIGFNVLELVDPEDAKEKNLVASGLMSIFAKLWEGAWSSRMEHILLNTILALLENPGTTLLGIPRMFADANYRQAILNNVSDPSVLSFWLNEYASWEDRYRKEAIAPIQNKVGRFLSTPLVRNIVGQSKSTIDIYQLMNEGKIFLVNLAKGHIGEDNSALLGAMLITKIQLAAMKRVEIKNEDERVDFYLYVDEFQNFATDSFATILSEARKYRLNLIIAHQYIGQLVTDTSSKVRDAIFGNVGTMLTFRVGSDDATFLEKEFAPEFESQDLINLPNRRIFIKLLVDGVSSRPFSANTLAPFKATEASMTEEEIIASSRKRYARPRYQIELEINESSGLGGASQMRERSAGAGEKKDWTPRVKARQSADTAADLAALGFDVGNQQRRPAQRQQEQRPRPPFQQRPPQQQTAPPAHRPAPAPYRAPEPQRSSGGISLSALAGGSAKEAVQKAPAVDVNALKESIQQSLKARAGQED